MKLDEMNKLISGTNEEEQFVANALEAIKIRFVSNIDELENSAAFAPEFAHQHFDETEKIVGYKNLRVDVVYTDASLFLTSFIKYEQKMEPCDDIEYKIRDALPSTQLDAYLSHEKFKQKIIDQGKFRPYGDLIAKFRVEQENGHGTRQFELYKFDKQSDERLEEGIKYLERAQSLAFWYIDAVTYTDEQDPRFFNYFLFESTPSTEDGLTRYKFAGYANLYRFYHHPDQDRVRISQMLVAPPFRHIGLGHRFLQAIYTDLWTTDSVFDITAETPADSFLYMRDYADCLNCSRMVEFSRESLLQEGFTAKLVEAALKKYKLNKSQTRRVYEILRLYHTNMNIATEREQYKALVMKRLKKSVMDAKKEGRRIVAALGEDEQSLAITMQALDPDQQGQQLDALYENVLECYKQVLSRLAMYEKSFSG